MTSLIIAAAQSTSVPGDIPRNVTHHLQFAEAAAERSVGLLVFPELSLTGYELAIARPNAIVPDDLRLAPLRHFATRAEMTIVVGAPVLNENSELFIAALAFDPDGSVSTYKKVHVPESERGVFKPGPGGSVLRVGNATVALAICADASHPQHAANAAASGAGVYAAGVMIDGEGYARKVPLLKNYAVEHRMAVLMANYSGVTGGEVSAGRSAIWSKDGQLLAESTGTEESLVIAVL